MAASSFPWLPSRRNFLQVTASGLAAGLLSRPLLLLSAEQGEQTIDPYGGFKIGLQSFSLRNFDVDTALQQTKKLGLHFWEAYPRHVPMGTVPAYLKSQNEKFQNADVKLVSYGVISFDSNESKAREVFDFAKAMGLWSISANPAKDKATFDLLEKLVEEYQIPIAIHNHGPGQRYDKVTDILTLVEGRHPLLGACVDTGHYLRSDEDPVEVVQKLGKRVFGVHLKDVRTIRDAETKGTRKQFTILGEGDLNLIGLLRELRAQGYSRNLSIEYEENPQNPLSDLELSLAAARQAVMELDRRDEEEFVSLWDGRSFAGWKINESPESWKIENGEIIALGKRSHLFYEGDQGPFKNFVLRVDVKAEPGSNSGIYFHTRFQEQGWPAQGFETQVNNTFPRDVRRTGSLYEVVDQLERMIPDNTWWTQEVTVQGKRVIVKVDGKVAVDYTEPEDFQPDPKTPERRFGSGTFALQAHDAKSIVHFKNLRVRKLPD